MRLEVSCDSDADELGVSGPNPEFGGWDATAAHRLARTPEAGEASCASFWTGDISIPPEGTDFKIVLFKDGDAVWEPLETSRRWPGRLGAGSVLKIRFGNPRIGIEVSAAQHEANARATRKLEERSGSALQENLDKKGENAYYHAHTRKFEVPADAKVITGPGLITGGAPVLLEAGAAPDSKDEDRTVWLKDFSWSDSTEKVKVYVPVPEGLLPAEGAEGIVEAAFKPTQVDVTIKSKPWQRLKIEKLNAEIKAESCTTRVEAHKNRIVLQLAKKKTTAWYSLTKK